MNSSYVPKFIHAFQPIIDVEAEAVYAYEALVRGAAEHNDPLSFLANINESEKSHFDQLIRESALQFAASHGLTVKLSLNMFSTCFTSSENYVAQTLDAAESLGVSAQDIILEISEAEMIHGVPGMLARLNEASSRGALIALDDFGAGYAGLNALIDVNPDIIKLDMHMVRGIESSGPRRAIVKALMGLAEDLGMTIIAEGVEKKDEFNTLRDLGVELYQGFLFSRPEIERLPKMPDLAAL